ncbi:MAG TPA: hypothetical protein VKI18_17300 [Albitalea sp.]|nr:hypothetical protein [Albitalea sp.]
MKWITRERPKHRLLATTLLCTANAMATPLNFDADSTGRAPAGWTCGATGKGTPRWTVEADAAATPPRKLLRQSGAAPFPWCVKDQSALSDGWVEVRFRALAGREDQAGGVVWRWKNGDNYYVARANALENNVSLYYTEGGVRKTLKYVDAPVAAKVWHTLRVEFTGSRILVLLDGQRRIELDDRHIGGAGAIGVWTKADSVTEFADFAYGGT